MTAIRTAIQKLFDYYAPRNIEILRVLVFYGLNWREGPLDQFPDSKKLCSFLQRSYEENTLALIQISKALDTILETLSTILNLRFKDTSYMAEPS